ncbi:NAD(P)-binding protein [Polychaeton citri CBS 116435]|uniref:NAD(P)-binding protein n=1 Tax=Polychaeton citri CBS 116435 TaxID=1314669 RepID=A0A9P4QFV4_9PEZI|nr:NAD(P)-binding protein [Polychaeton citri CBS 116435]
MPTPKLRVGILGAGEVAQVIHLPTLALLSDLFTTVSVCDISAQTAAHCAQKFHVSHSTTDPHAVIKHPDVDVVFVLTSDEQHCPLAVATLQAGKHVMIEKPITLSLPSAQRIIDAEKTAPNGARVFVGYMRRYATTFTQAFKREVGGIPRILYARSRDIVGPNSFFVSQSGTFQKRWEDFPDGAGAERERLMSALVGETFGGGEVTKEMYQYCRFLGSLGSHDLSLMREALGFPESVEAVSANEPFYSAIFNYKNKSGEPFAVTYESGIDMVPRFDAHLTVYGEKKTVSIHYDTPYVGVGGALPIKVRVDEMNEQGEAVSREILSSYQSAYVTELQELHECFANGKAIKTTAEDAREDLRLFDLMYQQYRKTRT